MRFVALLALVLTLSGPGSARADAPTGATLFDPIARVLMHPRCINCHQDESPRQTDAKIRHMPLVVRGARDRGAPTLPCQTCHQDTNTADGFVPGAPRWRLAKLSMLWEGKSAAQICQQIKDPAQGGMASGDEILEHVKTDPFVHWAWSPGASRTTPPLSHAEFVAAVAAWVAAGRPCPIRP